MAYMLLLETPPSCILSMTSGQPSSPSNLGVTTWRRLNCTSFEESSYKYIYAFIIWSFCVCTVGRIFDIK